MFCYKCGGLTDNPSGLCDACSGAMPKTEAVRSVQGGMSEQYPQNMPYYQEPSYPSVQGGQYGQTELYTTGQPEIYPGSQTMGYGQQEIYPGSMSGGYPQSEVYPPQQGFPQDPGGMTNVQMQSSPFVQQQMPGTQIIYVQPAAPAQPQQPQQPVLPPPQLSRSPRNSITVTPSFGLGMGIMATIFGLAALIFGWVASTDFRFLGYLSLFSVGFMIPTLVSSIKAIGRYKYARSNSEYNPVATLVLGIVGLGLLLITTMFLLNGLTEL